MNETRENERPPDDPTLLFAEFVELCESATPVDDATFADRAGPRAADLARRIEVYRALQEISSFLDPDAPPEPGNGALHEHGADLTRLGRFLELVPIGHGGLSRVFLARDPELGRRVALKVLRPNLLSPLRARGWIENEGQVLASVEHPAVVHVYELGEADGFAYLAMEYVDGPSLAALIAGLRARDHGPLGSDAPGATDRDAAADPRVARLAPQLASIAARCRMLLRLARALAVCHARHGVVHRDLKPGNVLVGSDGFPKLIDFGLGNLEARAESLTDVTQALVGTPAYLSPEQVDRGQTLASQKSDQFSFGALCYETLTLENAFARETRGETLDAVSRAAPTPLRRVNPEVPDDLERIVLHALERDPDERYPDMQALADDLEAFLDHRAISLAAPSLARRVRGWLRRNPGRVRSAALVVGVLVLAVLGLSASNHLSERAAVLEQLEAIREAIPELNEPDDFTGPYVHLQVGLQQAARLDGLFLARFTGNLRPDAERVAHELAARVAHRMKETDPGRVGKGPSAIEEQRKRWFDSWRALVATEEGISPDCEENLENRLRGTVELPDPPEGGSVELSVHTTQPSQTRPHVAGGFADRTPVERPRRVASELYRVLVRAADGTVVAETETVVHPADERRTVTPRPIDPELLAGMLEVPETSLTFDDDPDRIRIVEPFLIARRVLTWDDVRRIDPELAEVLMRRTPGSDHDGDAPARMTVRDAFELAGRCGARLPTGPELIAAALQGDLVLGDERVGGEYVSDQYLLTSMTAVGYRILSRDDPARCLGGPRTERGYKPILLSYKPDELALGVGSKHVAVRFARSR